jgi:gliding motility-associated-like protein
LGNTIVTLVLLKNIYTFIIPYIIMFAKKFLLLIAFLFLFCNLASAAIFTVTSNADSGTGTLREALTLAAANGSGVKDFINFNIADQSVVGRTIIITSQLPDVSSNLVIDGSTQPGLKFGVSDAKICLKFIVPTSQPLSGLKIIDQTKIEIYGLYINTEVDKNTEQFPPWAGIDMTNDEDIKIGAAGKGNVILGFQIPIYVNRVEIPSYKFVNLSVKSNFVGVGIDGITTSPNISQPISIYGIVGDVIFGGSPAEGNILAQGLTIYQSNTYDGPIDATTYYITMQANILIKNNKIGVNYFENQSFSDSRGINIAGFTPFSKSVINIEDNTITAQQGFGLAAWITNIGKPVTFLRNYIGTNKLRNKSFPTGGLFFAWDTEQVLVGSSNLADANYITNCIAVTIMDYSNVKVNKNSFSCAPYQTPMHYDGFGTFTYPDIKINAITPNAVSGTATPNSVIELFYSDTCGTCSPQTYFGTTTTDNNGNWTYIGPITGTVIASATFDKATSNFTTARIDVTNITVINACDDKGSIKGAIVSNTTNITWLNEAGQVAGTTADLIDVPPGKYKLVAGNGDCSSSTSYYEIVTRLKLVTASHSIKPSSCNNNDGEISGIVVINNDYDLPKISWKDQAGQERGTAIDLTGVPAGQYTLTVTSADGTCVKTYGPTTITNTDGPAINTTSLIKEDAHCDIDDGSIKNVQVTGTGTYLWTNEQGKDVGHNKNLTGVPAGKYKLTVTGTSCPPVSTAFIDILSIDGITIDDTGKDISKATCQYDNGGISNIKVTGATKYSWYNTGNNLVSSDLNLTGMPTGDYYLIAANDNGCSKQTATYTITREAPVSYSGVTKKLNDATCDENNGSIELIFEHAPAQLPESYKWLNPATGWAVITSTPIITGIDAGKYDIYATTNGCEQYIISYFIYRIPGLTVATNNVHVNDDRCSTGTGSIKGILAAGKTPLSFTWTDDNGINKGASPDLLNVTAGTYHLKVTDGSNCEQGFVYTVYDQSDALSSANVSDVQICSPGDVLLSVSNADSRYSYRLYEDNDGAAPIDEQQNGRFKVNVKANRSYYISQYFGNCESLREEVKVVISGLSGTDITNTFTPNGDGINDYWKIKGIENYTNGTIKIFSRDGKMVFQSKGYATPFDGTLNGKPLPVGVYYYIIDLKTCDLLSGNLTILR